MSSKLYLEGGGDSKEQKIRCREGFHKLLERCGFKGRMPRTTACGGRNSAYEQFKTALATKAVADFIALWIDSEDPVGDIEATWAHLRTRDGWDRPEASTDADVLLMTTCMETLVTADRNALRVHYGAALRENLLPSLVNLEARQRAEVHEKLTLATKDCSNTYAKGKRSFEILGKLDPGTLAEHLPSFARTRRILDEKLS